MDIDNTLAKLLASRDLTFDEAKGAMEDIVTGKVSDVKLAGWLVALRAKGETALEIAGCASVMREHSQHIKCHDSQAVDIVGTGGSGANTINISTAAAFVAAGAGVTVAKHGNHAVSSRSGSADVLSALGVNINLSPEKTEECLEEVGMAFLYARLLHPAMKHALNARTGLGIRTIFNILGPLTNPAGVKRYVLGVYNNKLCRLLADAGLTLGFEHSLIMHGCDGLDELTNTGPTYICEINKGEILEYNITPEELDIELALPSDLRGGTPEENAMILKDTLSGKLIGPKRDIVVLSAAAAIYMADKSDCWEYAIEKAEESIDSGLALKKLKKLIAFTNL